MKNTYRSNARAAGLALALNLVAVNLVVATLGWALASTATAGRPNILFIAVDDLRPELNCYGRTHIHSPNIDRLASGGVLFERSYCMVPTCGASRSSLMTGLRPSPKRFVSYLTRADKDAPGVTTLNTQLANNGYETISLGKVFHHRDDSEVGWAQPAWRPAAAAYHIAANNQLQGRKRPNGKPRRGPAFESADAPDQQYADGMTADKAIGELQRLTQRDTPFFLAVGFVKPHLPFVAPKKYWDLYDPAEIHLPENYNVPQDAPEESIHNSGELRAYHGIPAQGPVSNETARNLIHGYYACVSFVDAQIGRVLDELERLGIADETIVVLWGDHGWNLGDHTLWCKHSCYESSMHAPLIVRAPGIDGGAKTAGLTEFIDIYPSLCDLAGIEKPAHLQGRSFVPLLHDPEMQWKTAAIGRFQTGDTIRTDQYRFTQYATKNGKPTARMLYDHAQDPLENVNLAETVDAANLVRSLGETLAKNKGKDN